MFKNNNSSDAIKTYVRIRPTTSQQAPLFQITNEKVVIPKTNEEFIFDKVFNEKVTNQQVFSQTILPIIKKSFQGYNSCILAYGQTCSGKTFTMKGQSTNMGIIPLTVKEIFKKINEDNRSAKVLISYMEIYNQNLIDLLSDKSSSLEIREDNRKNVNLPNLSQVIVNSEQDAFQIYQKGQTKRKFATTGSNHNSSRSHCILRIQLQIIREQDHMKLTSQIHMVDLAGSQGVSKTKAEGIIRKQGDCINKSLLALSNVIRSLSQKAQYVNFRDSKLTRLLQTSLCNNSKSIVICTVYPTAQNFAQTINTLKFGHNAAKVKISSKVNYGDARQQTPPPLIFRKMSSKDIQFNDRSQGVNNQVQDLKNIIDQNMKQINELKNEILEYKSIKEDNDRLIANLKLQNYQSRKELQNVRLQLMDSQSNMFQKEGINEQKSTLLQRQVKKLKQQLKLLSDSNDQLRQANLKLQANERNLTDVIESYKRQSQIAKQQTKKLQRLQTIPEVPEAQSKSKITKNKYWLTGQNIKSDESTNPFILDTIMILKTKILELKKQLYHTTMEAGNLLEQKKVLEEKVRKIEQQREQRDQQKLKQNNLKCNKKYSQAQSNQIRHLNRKINRLKKQQLLSRKRQQKLKKALNKAISYRMNEVRQFQNWIQNQNSQNCEISEQQKIQAINYEMKKKINQFQFLLK